MESQHSEEKVTCSEDMLSKSHSEHVVKVPKWLSVVAIIALLWNLVGVLAFVGQITISPEALSQLPQAEQDIYINMPIWAYAAFATAVFFGATASVMLLCKMGWAVHLFIGSLLAISVQMYHAFFIARAFDVFGPGGLIMPVMVISFAIIFLKIALLAKKNNWLA